MFGKFLKSLFGNPKVSEAEEQARLKISLATAQWERQQELNKEFPPNDLDAPGLAKKAQARGRYELAGQLLSEYAKWYGAHVVGNPSPNESPENIERFKEFLAYYQNAHLDMALAAADRDAIVTFVNSKDAPITRKELEAACPIRTDMKYGVFLNQLVRGDWLNETGEGKNRRYGRSSAKRLSDAEFLRLERGKPPY